MTASEGFREWLRSMSTSQSRAVENLIEHAFLADCLQESWFRRREELEVARADVDASGYYLILHSRGVTRHVQLKASRKGGRTNRQTVNARLQQRRGGCVVWVIYDVDEETGRTDLQYLWKEASDLPDRVGRHTRGAKAARPNTRVLTRGSFERLGSVSELLDRLFGPEATTP